MSLRQERRGHKNLWIVWLIQLLRKWIKDNKMKIWKSEDMKWKRNLEKEWKMREDLSNLDNHKLKWQSFFSNRWMIKRLKNKWKKLWMMSRQWYGSKIRLIMKKKREDWWKKLRRLIMIMRNFLRSKWKRRKWRRRERWIKWNFLWISLFLGRSIRS